MRRELDGGATEIPIGIPTPTLAVIGAGFGRTGTLSLRLALERLGFAPCDHMSANFERPARFAHWLEAVRRKHAGLPIDWRPLLDGYRAAVDWPAAYFWRELAAAHPLAKVILTTRDPDRWYESAQATIWAARQARQATPLARWRARLAAVADPALGRGFRTVEETVWAGSLGGQFADRAETLRRFNAHNADVVAAIAAERLLVFDVKDGWGPLCAFLSVPVPDEPFPRANDAAEFAQRQRAQGKGAARLLRVLGVLALLGFAVLGLRLAMSCRQAPRSRR
jgi:hypothetical protein